ncbi:DUF2721 domain-containing protein [Singulisphaera acidiphila]|uniref:DUF2721 domain-containing protein n=1 Tax=Singulisphaera acidiphila (strain ATCC BAA-1392 / DSM 18658 / VKM B-2454 / MOB10) TaxID=886293 RepID=L0D8A9_SINAD|nr:DUF2721 domain-containing protein [Singulisphaera acidiphila]AGA25105.1 Protein of unknown function (DUF2721) [Singulisphaera acidiphila DSM 18658]
MPLGLSSDIDAYATLSAMITPAIFLTANGSLIISTSNRMSRIVDRIRVLNDLGDRIGRRGADFDYPKERLANVEAELDRLVWRSYRIRYALVTLYLAFGAFVGTSLTLAIDVWTDKHSLIFLPTLLAVLGVFMMLAACVNLVREALEALRGNRKELWFFRELQARRKADETEDSPNL